MPLIFLNEYYDIYHDIRNNVTDYTFISIVDPKHDNIRYTISKYSKGLRKYFDPHKVVKAVYSIDNILFYVKNENQDAVPVDKMRIRASPRRASFV